MIFYLPKGRNRAKFCEKNTVFRPVCSRRFFMLKTSCECEKKAAGNKTWNSHTQFTVLMAKNSARKANSLWKYGRRTRWKTSCDLTDFRGVFTMKKRWFLTSEACRLYPFENGEKSERKIVFCALLALISYNSKNKYSFFKKKNVKTLDIPKAIWYNAEDKGITARFFRESGTLKTLSETKREGFFEECYRNLGAQCRRRTIGDTPKNREARRRSAYLRTLI